MMILVKVSYQHAIALPAALAGVAAELMAKGVLLESDHYSENKWKPSKEAIELRCASDDVLGKPTEREVALEKAKSDSDSKWYKEYTENQAAKKTIADLERQLELLKSVTTCTVTPQTDGDVVDAELPL